MSEHNKTPIPEYTTHSYLYYQYYNWCYHAYHESQYRRGEFSDADAEHAGVRRVRTRRHRHVDLGLYAGREAHFIDLSDPRNLQGIIYVFW